MKRRGNIASNKEFNPKNKQPDIPLDADEIDSAMERFVRKKYVERSLVDGRPVVPSRTEASPSLTQSTQPSPTPDLPAPGKKHKFFGFSLRTSSKKDRAGVENAFKITPVEYSPTTGITREVPESEIQDKLAQLRDMGFRNQNYVPHLLRDNGGDLERTIARLVKLPADIIGRDATPPPDAKPKERPAAPIASSTTNNPWAQLDQPQQSQTSGIGISFETPDTPQRNVPSANPWQSAMSNQNTGLEQSMANMQVSNPLFPHHTGGYTQQSYQDPRLQTMTPPALPQQYGSASPSSNPYQQYVTQPLSSQSTGTNPFLQQQQQSQPVFAPSFANNPFLNMQQLQQQPSMPVPNNMNNPFGLPPSQNQPQLQSQQYVQSPQPQAPSSNPFSFAMQGQQPQPQIQHAQTFPQPQQQSYNVQSQASQPQIPNFDYGQPQGQQQQQAFQPSQQQQYQQYQPQQAQQYQSQQPQQQQFQPQQQLQPQATGRYTKTDIMALFNTPSAFQPQHLAPVQESEDVSQQPVSPAPSNNPYGGIAAGPAKRAATMPVGSQMGSRNPFLASGVQQAHGNWQQGVRHASNESVSVNNPGLMDGRHSPDAFASLSSRY